jgi:hypothetical protein
MVFSVEEKQHNGVWKTKVRLICIFHKECFCRGVRYIKFILNDFISIVIFNLKYLFTFTLKKEVYYVLIFIPLCICFIILYFFNNCFVVKLKKNNRFLIKI